MGITIRCKGNFKKTEKFLNKFQNQDYSPIMKNYAEIGVKNLKAYTPIDTGETANKWGYEIDKQKDHISIYWKNSHIHKGVNIALILQYGHATRNGGYVPGQDYINPALEHVYKDMIEAVWKEVIKI